MDPSNFAPLPDLRAVRTTFLGKELAYALSYEYTLEASAFYAVGPKAVRLLLKLPNPPPPGSKANHPSAEVFHVLGDQRVPGLDGLGHELPSKFAVTGLSESVLGSIDETFEKAVGWVGTIEGRMVLQAPSEKTDGALVRITVSYDGTLRLPHPFTVEDLDPEEKNEIHASAYVIPFFETTHPKYHWLTENACIAFGKWTLKDGIVHASYDVYSAE